jgi:hypothetical protein
MDERKAGAACLEPLRHPAELNPRLGDTRRLGLLHRVGAEPLSLPGDRCDHARPVLLNAATQVSTTAHPHHDRADQGCAPRGQTVLVIQDFFMSPYDPVIGRGRALYEGSPAQVQSSALVLDTYPAQNWCTTQRSVRVFLDPSAATDRRAPHTGHVRT